jgi:hypothetical protein
MSRKFITSVVDKLYVDGAKFDMLNLLSHLRSARNKLINAGIQR